MASPRFRSKPVYRDAIDKAIEHVASGDPSYEKALSVIEALFECADRVATSLLPMTMRGKLAAIKLEEALFLFQQDARLGASSASSG